MKSNKGRFIRTPGDRLVQVFDTVIVWKDDPDTLVDALIAVDDDLYIEFYENDDDEDWQFFSSCLFRCFTCEEWEELLADPVQQDEDWSFVRFV